jgi:hypothetical protein
MTAPKTLRLLRKVPGQDLQWIEIPDTLEALQREVGGHIKTVTLCSDLVLIFNEVGRGLPPCCIIGGYKLRGPVLFAAPQRDELRSLTELAAEAVRSWIREPGGDGDG